MRKSQRGLTLVELLLAMFVLMVGVVGAMAALPTGITSAEYVILQDASLNLAHSKFAQFRRDRINPLVDLKDGSAYMPNGSEAPQPGKQEPANAAGWREFAHNPGDPYEDFDDIWRYQWKVDQNLLLPVKTSPTGPVHGSGSSTLARVVVVVRLRNSPREFRFCQYMDWYDARQ